MNTDPVIVPIQVDLGPAQAGVNQLGQTIETARRTGGGGTAGGGAPPAGGPGGPAIDITTARTLVAALGNLTTGVTALTGAVAQLTQTIRTMPTGPSGAQPQPGIPPPPQVQPQQPPQPQPQQQPQPGPGFPGVGQTMAGAQRFGGQVLRGGLATLGIGFGVDAAWSAIRGWMNEARELHTDLARAALQGGGGPAETEQLLGEIKGAGPSFVRGPEALRGVQQFRQAGMTGPGAGRAAITAGDLGLTAYGNAGAGMDVLARGGEVFRTDTSTMEQLLATIVQQGRITNVTDAQMLDQFRSLTSLYEQTQGQGVRSKEDLQGIATLQRWLTGLPGRIGEGAAGAQIAGGLASISSRGPIGQMVGLSAYRGTHGKPPGWYPSTPDELVDVEIFGQDPKNAPQIAQNLRNQLGPAVAARFFSQQTGVPLRAARELFAQPGPLSAEQVRQAELLSPERARELAAERQKELQEKTIGGQELLRTSVDELTRATSTTGAQMLELEQTVRRVTTELIPLLDRLVNFLEQQFGTPAGAEKQEPMPPVGTQEWLDWFIAPSKKILKGHTLSGDINNLPDPMNLIFPRKRGATAADRGVTGVPDWMLPPGGGPTMGGPVSVPFRGGPGLASYQPPREQYGTAGTISELETMGTEWTRRHPGARLGIGDISLAGGGHFSPHVSHQRGVDFDIRPARTDLSGGPTRIGASTYSPAATQELVDMILKMVPGAIVGFADPNIRGTHKWRDHQDHLHVRFPESGQRRRRRPREQQVSLNISMDPGFPGRVSTEGSPGVKVRNRYA